MTSLHFAALLLLALTLLTGLLITLISLVTLEVEAPDGSTTELEKSVDAGGRSQRYGTSILESGLSV